MYVTYWQNKVFLCAEDQSRGPHGSLLQEEAGDDAEDSVVDDQSDDETLAHRGHRAPGEGAPQLTLIKDENMYWTRLIFKVFRTE